MRNISKDAVSPSPTLFAKGQLWQYAARFMKIGHVGRLLVHHRIVDPSLKRTSRESITSIKALQEFLTANDAVLVENTVLVGKA